jgi:hypothetical protein
MTTQTPKKGCKVLSPYAGRALVNGSTAPDRGTITAVSRGYAYVDFGVGTMLETIRVEDLEPVTELNGNHFKNLFRDKWQS